MSTKISLSFKCASNLLLATWPALNVYIHSQKTNSSSSWQLRMDVWGWRAPDLALGPFLAWTCAGPVHATTVSMSWYMCRFSYVCKTLLSRCSLSLMTLSIFPLQIPIVPWSSQGRGFMETSHLGLSAQISYSLYIVEFQVSMLVPISCKRRLLWWWPRETHTHGHSRSQVFNQWIPLTKQ